MVQKKSHKNQMSLFAEIDNTKMLVISKKICVNCSKLKAVLQNNGVEYRSIVLEDFVQMCDDDEAVFNELENLKKTHNIKMYPVVFINQTFVQGGYSELKTLDDNGLLGQYLSDKGVIVNNDDF